MKDSNTKSATLHQKQITYWWKVSETLSQIVDQDELESILDEDAQNHIHKMLSEGFREGELVTNIGDSELSVYGAWLIKDTGSDVAVSGPTLEVDAVRGNNSTFIKSTVFKIYSEDFGFLEVPFEGCESEIPSVVFCKDTFTLKASYKALVDGKRVSVEVTYICHIAQFLKQVGLLDLNDYCVDDALWDISDHKIISL